jgi:hypothetical protein
MMAKYILSKYQIQRLVDGKEIIDSNGRKFLASESVKEQLSKLDCEKYEVVFENGELGFRKKV